MKSQSLTQKWITFLLVRDTISKTILGLSAITIAIWFLAFRDSVTFALVAFGALVFGFVFSFLNYVTVGRYREVAEQKFYDAIYSDCDFAAPYTGRREMKKIKVQWSGLKVNRVIVHANTNSSVAKSGKQWRNLKLAVSDCFKLTGTQVVAILGNQTKGHFEFVAVTDQQVAPGGEYSAADFEEKLLSFIYESLSSFGTPLPRLRCFEIDEDGRSKPRIKRFDILLQDTPSTYSKSDFEKHLKANHESSAKVWIFNWTEDGVAVEAIPKGSDREKRVIAEASVLDLISASVRTSFNWYDKKYILTPKMIRWTPNETPETITIDFLQNDVSETYHVEKFEDRVRQGLAQQFRGIEYSFEWNVSATEKILTIRA